MTRSTRVLLFLLAGALIAGTIDILYAISFWAIKAGVAPQRILQSVASGILGQEAFQGGTSTAALGLVLHFLLATIMSITCFWLAGRITLLVRRPLLAGAVYGLGLYLVMNFIVVPLSAASPGSTDPSWIVLSVAVHMFLVGIPMALAARAARLGAAAV